MLSFPLPANTRIPPLTWHAIHRDRLIDRLDGGALDDATRLIVLAAPAGYGKTTLLSQWAKTTAVGVGECAEHNASHIHTASATGRRDVQPAALALASTA